MRKNPNHVALAYKEHLNQLVDMFPGLSVIDTKQLATLLGVTKNTIYKLMEKDKIGYVRVGDLYKFPIVDVAKFLARETK